jgi:S-adenosylmethionine hydrolase
VFLAVVDPGVGSERRAVAVETRSGAVLVGPDNGLLSMAWGELGGAECAVEIAADDVLLRPVSRTFHGRDVFAPAAAHLAAGRTLDELGPRIAVGDLQALELPGPMVTPGVVGARVVGVDNFGNVQLNVTPAELADAGIEGSFTVGVREIPRASAFSDVAPGACVAIVDSQGYIAIVVNRGSASQALGLSPGDAVVLGG